MSQARWVIFVGLAVIFGLGQLCSQLATLTLWGLEKDSTGRHARFPWFLAYYFWMFSTPRWASQSQQALALLKRMRILGAGSLVAFVLMVLTALTSAST